MHRRLTVLLAALAATLVLAVTAATATANRSLVGGRVVRDIARAVTFTDLSGREVICDVTMTKSFHQSIAKVPGTLAGMVTEGRTANCRNNLGLLPTGVIILPGWHIVFNAFTGTLPKITEVLFIIPNARILIFIQNTRCLYEGIAGRNTSGVIGPAEFIMQRLIFQPRQIPLFFVLEAEVMRQCGRQLEIRGAFNIEPAVVLRLV